VTTAPHVLYLLTCGATVGDGIYDFVRQVLDDGWQVCAVTTPMGNRFVDADRLRTLTGNPVRSTYKNPDDPDVLPPGDVFVVAPATFNTVNKIANGISDTLGVGLICEAIGNDKPVIVAPWSNRALARHGAYARSLQCLRDDSVRLVLTARTEPGGPITDPGGQFPWDQVLTEVRKLGAVDA
jgi:phosphopantothenoylcysteine synthetase/decarboxylase